ncbi:hypothetical protein DPMN_125900 [Dreissena polymorpha]|uniref:Uncharacterized protein n=1 Tax=Dreissena polymorpha TaxID=45954 RepID=A0A9D4H2A7_DREPO|nr:hypothetical protein DPMN_125900 [Dreissena polymorpha]
MCDGEPLTRNINSDHDPGIAVIKNSHPMLASLFTEANNVSDRTNNSGFGSSMPETANKQQIANLANVTNGQESAIGDLPEFSVKRADHNIQRNA